MLFRPRNKPDLSARLRSLLWPRTGLARAWRYIGHRITRISATPHSIALGMATGVFMSFSPLIGFHIVSSAIICFFTGGNVLAAAFGTMLCNPLMCPIMMLGDFQIGNAILGHSMHKSVHLHLPEGILLELFTDPVRFWHDFWGALGPVFLPLAIGGAILGLLFAVPSYFLVRSAVAGIRRRRTHRLSRRRAAHHHAAHPHAHPHPHSYPGEAP